MTGGNSTSVVVAGVVSTVVMRWGLSASQVSVRWTFYPVPGVSRFVA
jgi:hypothetical protein